MSEKLNVLLTTEGTYPFHQGGVSTWCDILVSRLKDVDYSIYAIMMDPFVTQKFKLPESASLIRMPLWGTEEPSEHLATPFSENFLAKQRTTARVIHEQFIPLFEELMEEIIAIEKNSDRLARVLVALYDYFQTYEYKVSFKAEETWDTFKRIVLTRSEDHLYRLAKPDLYCLIQSLGWIYRFLNILNTPVPKTDVTHASAAAFCGIPCVISKVKYGTPFLLTEHGVYLREQYLSLGKRDYSSYLNTFLIRMIHSVSSLCYSFADQISPVCQYNTRWELRFDVPRERIQVIYNGVDKSAFPEGSSTPQSVPTVVTIARIDPLKDILTLIKSAAVVKAKIPNVKFIIYGSVSVPAYYEECLALRDKLELADTVVFAGHTSNMAAAYQSGDVVALTSISEAFPYSVVEAMMTGKPCISTDVGGIREAVGTAGIMVPPRDYDAIAEGIVKLLNEPETRLTLGQEGRERALSFFTLEKVLEQHLKTYLRLAVGDTDAAAAKRPVAIKPVKRSSRLRKQRELVEKAYAFMAIGAYLDAVRHFQLSLLEVPNSASAPVILMEIAQCYNVLGEYDKAFAALEKEEALRMVTSAPTA